jgi:hypothetical protein
VGVLWAYYMMDQWGHYMMVLWGTVGVCNGYKGSRVLPYPPARVELVDELHVDEVVDRLPRVVLRRVAARVNTEGVL